MQAFTTLPHTQLQITQTDSIKISLAHKHLAHGYFPENDKEEAEQTMDEEKYRNNSTGGNEE